MVQLDQIRSLIEQSEALEYRWEQWFLIGGEPTAHPKLREILRVIAEYRDRRMPEAFDVTIATHGATSHAKMTVFALQREFPFLKVLNSQKTSRLNRDFVATCVAPIDRAKDELANHRFIGCGVSWHCGVSMNYAGFYCCAIAGAIDRVFGFGKAIARLEDLTVDNIYAQYQVFCALCGFYQTDTLKPITGADRTILSASWKAALEKRRDDAILDQVGFFEG